MTRGWTIEHACPQCGAQVELDEADRILSCKFCRVRHYLMPHERFRYVLPPADGIPAEELFFAPYWRFRGMACTCRAYDVDCRVVDTSVCGAGAAPFPKTLGFRPQAMKLHFARADNTARHMPLALSAGDFAGYFTEQYMQSKKKVFFRECIGEAVSLIYAPFYIYDDKLYDGVLKRFTGFSAKKFDAASIVENKSASWGVSFVPTLCPNCGWDMVAEKESCVLLCPKCSRAWLPSSSGLKAVAYEVMQSNRENIRYIPFWRMQAAVSGVSLQSQADLIRFANLPVAVTGAMAEEPVSFWAPAFKIKPQLFLRLARQVMAQQPVGKSHDLLDGLDLYPITLPLREAAESIKVSLALLAARRNKAYPALARMKIAVQSGSIVFLPFTVKTLELVNESLCLAIGRAALRFGRGI